MTGHGDLRLWAERTAPLMLYGPAGNRGPRLWQLANGRRNIGAGRQRGRDLLDLGLPLAPRRLEHCQVVLCCEVRAEPSDRRELDLATGQEIEDDRERRAVRAASIRV